MEIKLLLMKNLVSKEDFSAWCDKKGLMESDLIHILSSVILNPDAFPRQNPLAGMTTEQLVRELIRKPDVESGMAGPYQRFEVKRKYSNDRSEITDAAVLVIPHLVL